MANIRLINPMATVQQNDLLHLSNFGSNVGSHRPSSNVYWTPKSTKPQGAKIPNSYHITLPKMKRT